MRATQRMLVAMDEDYGGQVAVLFLSEHTGEDPEGYAAMAAHSAARAAGRGHWYRPSRLHVATIDRSHGWARV